VEWAHEFCDLIKLNCYLLFLLILLYLGCGVGCSGHTNFVTKLRLRVGGRIRIRSELGTMKMVKTEENVVRVAHILASSQNMRCRGFEETSK
jgi:hypothetical protein